MARAVFTIVHTTVLHSGAARVDFFAGAEPIIGLEFVIMLATARELTQPRALRSHYLDHDDCSAVPLPTATVVNSGTSTIQQLLGSGCNLTHKRG